MAEFDNAELLTDIRERGGLPSADLRFTDAKLLAAASLELRDVVSTLLIESQADRMVYLSDIAVTSGTATYRLPSRAVAGRWQSVGWKGQGDTQYTRMRHLSPSAYYLQSDSQQTTPFGFFVRDYHLTLVPTPSQTGTLRIPYYMRPNTLVATSAAGRITDIDAGLDTITLSSIPSGFVVGAVVEAVRGTPGFETLAQSQTIIQVSGLDIIVSPGPVTDWGLAIGDYMCLAGQAPVAQIPVELRGLLAARAARRALKAVNEGQQAQMLDGDVEELTAVARALLSPRVDDEPQEWGDSRRGLLFGVVR